MPHSNPWALASSSPPIQSWHMTVDGLLNYFRPKQATEGAAREPSEEGEVVESSSSGVAPPARANINPLLSLATSAEAFDALPTQEIIRNALITFLALARRADQERRERETLVEGNETLRTRVQTLESEKQMLQAENGTLRAEDGRLRAENRLLRSELDRREDLSELVENFERQLSRRKNNVGLDKGKGPASHGGPEGHTRR